MRLYYAQYTHGDLRYDVGRFHSHTAADQFGLDNHSEEVQYTGWAQLKSAQTMIRMLAAATVTHDTPAGTRSGVITRWDPGATHGFLTDAEGRSWFVSQDQLPPGLTEPTVPAHVSFSGTPDPQRGKKYPQAYSIRLVNG